jgi:hypothetical protein
MELRFAKVARKTLLFETAYQRRTPGFEINDIGFLRQADQQAWTNWATSPSGHPIRFSGNCAGTSTTGNTGPWRGFPPSVPSNTNVHTQFKGNWWLHMGGTLGQVGTTYCDRCARGGPAIRQDMYIAPGLATRETIARRSSRFSG